MSGLADFGSFFFSPARRLKIFRLRRALGNHFSIFSPPAANHFSKNSACGGLRALTFPFFASGGQSLFQKKNPLAAGSGQSLFHFFASGGQSLFQKNPPAAGSGQSLFHFFMFAVNHFSKKIAFGGFGQSLFHFFTSGGFSANHFSTFHLRRSITFPKKIASGGYSVNNFFIFSPPADFQLSIFKV